MIDPATETVIPFQAAPRHIPGRPAICTLHRWRAKGVRGRKLETFLRGGRRFTTIEAIARFLLCDDPVETPDFNDHAIQRRANQAGRELDERGLSSA